MTRTAQICPDPCLLQKHQYENDELSKGANGLIRLLSAVEAFWETVSIDSIHFNSVSRSLLLEEWWLSRLFHGGYHISVRTMSLYR